MTDPLEDSLRAGGAKVSEGTFKVDARRALAKLREYRLAEPHAWVLEVLRAAAFSNARTVEVETDADDVKVTFGGTVFPAAVMSDLLAQALDSKGAGPARYLSLGVAGALGLNPKWIRLRSGKVSLEIIPPDQVKTLDSKDGDAGTFLHVRKRFGWNVVKASIADTSPEETAIFKSAPAFGPTLTHNGKAVNGDRFPGGFVASAEFKNDRMHVIVGVPASAKHGQLVFDVGGVVVARREVDLPGQHLVAWARCDAMRRNASGSDVVDSDPAVIEVRKRINALALEVIAQMGDRLATAPAIWRKRFQAYALVVAKDPKQHPGVPEALAHLPLIPGLHDVWHSAAEFQKEKDAGRPVYFTTQVFPPGSYPTPIVRLHAEVHDPIAALLPEGAKRVDAAKLVQRRVRAAEHKARWLSAPLEAAALPPGRYSVQGEIAMPTLTGAVGLVGKTGAGAFIRVLCQGRFLQQGQVAMLAGLRLRAVVDLKSEVTEAQWAEMPSDKQLRAVAGAVEAAAERAVLGALGPDPTQPAADEIQSHARDLIVRRANLGASLAKLPDALKAARLLETTDGTRVSLEAMAKRSTWHFVRTAAADVLLSGEPVLLLADRDLRDALGQLVPKRLKDASDRLTQERGIRKRIAGPKVPAQLDGKHRVVVRIEEDGLTGEVAVPREYEAGSNLRVLRDGVLLERNRITELGEHAVAIIDSKDFVPNDDWDTAARDATWSRALRAIRTAVEQLPAVLVKEHPQAIGLLGDGHVRFLAHYLRKHLVPGSAPHPSAEAVAAAPLFQTCVGPRSLADLRKEVAAGTRVWHLPQGAADAPDTGMLIVYVRAEHAVLLGTLLGGPLEDAAPELERRRRADAYLARPVVKLQIGEGVLLRVELSADGVRGPIGFVDKLGADTALTLVVQDRVFASEKFLSDLPMEGMLAVDGVDPSDRELPAGPRAAVYAALPLAEAEILNRALDAPTAPGARNAMLYALAERLDQKLPSGTARRLLDVTLFDCSDGVMRSARTLSEQKRVLFVWKAIRGETASKEPVVVVGDAATRAVLKRWTTEDVTQTFAEELEARAARERLPRWDAVRITEPATWKRAFFDLGVEGELGILPVGGGRLTLLANRRPLAVVEGALPDPLSAVVNCDALKPAPLGTGVLIDDAYAQLVAVITAQAYLLLDSAAEAVEGADDDQRRALGAMLAPLAHWLVAQKQRTARLVKAPLFETTGRKLISLDDILAENKRHKSVLWSRERGEPLNDDRWVWRPRIGEDVLLRSQLSLKDATPAILHAREVRGRPKVFHLRARVAGDWREPLNGAVEGEVALPDKPTGELLVELHRERVPLEQVSSEHAVGAVACVNADGLSANADWSRATRNLAFKRAMADVEDAVERLVARRLAHRDVYWRDYAEAALKWKHQGTGPLVQAIAALPLFLDLRGRERTVGEVLEQQARQGRVLVADPGLPAPDDRVVFAHSALSDRMFDLLQVKTEDIGPLLKRKEALAAALKDRRLASLKHEGHPIARLDVQGEGFRGELVVLGAGEQAGVVLAKNGIRVCTRAIAGDLPVGGVVDVEELVVDDEWTKGELPRPVAQALEAFVEPLFAQVAASATRLDPAGRAHARAVALEFLAEAGVASPRHLERMTGAAAALAAAPLFLTEDGVWVSLAAIADHALARGWVSVFEQSWRKRDTGGELVLRAAALNDPWIAALEAALGSSCVERVRDVGAWRAQLAERDPPEATAEAVGLQRLRHQMKLLRAGALGHVTPDELDDVRIRKGGAPAPISYDPKRKLAVLDGDDPAIARALAEIPARPERLYVLLAAIYGAVNRALERITDDDEADLLGALATHLAANPKLLRPDPK